MGIIEGSPLATCPKKADYAAVAPGPGPPMDFTRNIF